MTFVLFGYGVGGDSMGSRFLSDAGIWREISRLSA